MDNILLWTCVVQFIAIFFITFSTGKRLNKVEESILECQVMQTINRLKTNVLEIHILQFQEKICKELNCKNENFSVDEPNVLDKMEAIENLITNLMSKNSKKTSS